MNPCFAFTIAALTRNEKAAMPVDCDEHGGSVPTLRFTARDTEPGWLPGTPSPLDLD